MRANLAGLAAERRLRVAGATPRVPGVLMSRPLRPKSTVAIQIAPYRKTENEPTFTFMVVVGFFSWGTPPEPKTPRLRRFKCGKLSAATTTHSIRTELPALHLALFAEFSETRPRVKLFLKSVRNSRRRRHFGRISPLEPIDPEKARQSDNMNCDKSL